MCVVKCRFKAIWIYVSNSITLNLEGHFKYLHSKCSQEYIFQVYFANQSNNDS